jgi:hypothetical protein
MALWRPNSVLLDNTEFSSLLSAAAVPVQLPAPRFLMFSLKDTDKTMRNIRPLYKQRHSIVLLGK